MGLRFVRRRTLPDGRIEVFTPKLVDGYYVLADRAVDPQHNKAVNEFYVRDPVAVAARLRRGGVSMRMRGDRQVNLISASEIEIKEEGDEPARASDRDGDPFHAFNEWSEAEDEAAWRHL
jgi:hypothetical protein